MRLGESEGKQSGEGLRTLWLGVYAERGEDWRGTIDRVPRCAEVDSLIGVFNG